MKRTRILLQQRETGLYFKDIDSWAPRGSEAMDFFSSTTAIDFCVANKLSGVHVVMKFEEEPYEFVWPILAAARNGKSVRPRPAI